MEVTWDYKEPTELSDDEKDEIIEDIFNIVLDNEMSEDVGEEVINYVLTKGYVFQENINECFYDIKVKDKINGITIPDVKVSEFYELYHIHYGDKGEFIKIKCNIDKEDLEKEMEYYHHTNYPFSTDILVFDFPMFLSNRGYDASVEFDRKPIDINFPNIN